MEETRVLEPAGPPALYAKTPTIQLIERVFGAELPDLIDGWRADGWSWETMANHVRRHGIAISNVGLQACDRRMRANRAMLS